MKRTIARYWVCLPLLAAVLFLVGCGDQAGGLKGTVTGAQDGEPVAGAEIVVFALDKVEGAGQMDVFTKGAVLQEQVTGEDGAFSFSLAPGDYALEVQLDGVEAADGKVQVRSGRTTAVDFEVSALSP
jgi:hypothetical protein